MCVPPGVYVQPIKMPVFRLAARIKQQFGYLLEHLIVRTIGAISQETTEQLSVMEVVRQFLGISLDLLFPRTCLVCERHLRSGFACTTCRPELNSPMAGNRCHACYSPIESTSSNQLPSICPSCRTLPLPFNRLRFVWDYDPTVRNFIRAIKYKPSRRLARYTGECLGEILPLLFEDSSWDLLVPIPSSRKTLRMRGFHHCLLISQSLQKGYSQVTGEPLELAPILYFKSERPAQATLSHKERLNNLTDSMVCIAKQVTGKRILLFDDVITTGATSNNAAQALLNAGARSVDMLALARSPRWIEYRQLLMVYSRSINFSGSYDRGQVK